MHHDNQFCFTNILAMIKNDRVELNERFCVAFNMLEERGIIVKNDRGGKGIGDCAERVLGNRAYGHIIRGFLNDSNDRVVSYTQARAFCREFGVNESWMLDGEGSPFGMSAPKIKEGATLMPASQSAIMFTTVNAFAGTSVDTGTTEEEKSYFSLPDLKGIGLVAFPVNGNSMEPIIQNGDIVVCRELNSLMDVNDNDIYAVKNNGSLWIKYVQKIVTKNHVSELKLISANYLEHDPFYEEVNEFTRLYKVVRKITEF